MQWMYWTPVTAAFFLGIALILTGMTIAQFLYPTVERQGFLPLATTRGDRLFIGLLSSAYIHLAWLGLAGLPLWWATLLCIGWVAVLFRWG